MNKIFFFICLPLLFSSCIDNSKNESIIEKQNLDFKLCSEKPFLDKSYKPYFCIKSDGVYYI
jgi:hypothetical protein